MENFENNKLYDIKETKNLLGLSELTIGKYIRCGKIKAKKIKRKFFISENEIKRVFSLN